MLRGTGTPARNERVASSSLCLTRPSPQETDPKGSPKKAKEAQTKLSADEAIYLIFFGIFIEYARAADK